MSTRDLAKDVELSCGCCADLENVRFEGELRVQADTKNDRFRIWCEGKPTEGECCWNVRRSVGSGENCVVTLGGMKMNSPHASPLGNRVGVGL